MSPAFSEQGIELWCGDCREILPLLSGVDAVVTDPPYGNGCAPRGGRTAGSIDLNSGGIPEWDIRSDEWMLLIGKIPAMVFCAQATVFETAKSLDADGLLIYAKNNPSPFGTSYEPCLTRGINRPRQWQHWEGYNAENGMQHPTQKPLRLMEWLLEAAPLGTVLDPFMGSGTTGIACISTGRKFIGIEKDPKHFQAALERIKRELSQPQMFPPALMAPKVIQPEMI